ncbi:right-handed parallel beta-helix repeat-containing protein [Streptomyces sp. NBC_01186]|uniref:right-handed parallel beta-helix repeat-containing protein n=1 Tax=Streptomyces sp. NBC_01186 TaxID=2903765 RepID=UPI002E0E65E1|nr:right-handed parallel beta-helix repeat-containing protein [Streptomyces sp. NBC_01186]
MTSTPKHRRRRSLTAIAVAASAAGGTGGYLAIASPGGAEAAAARAVVVATNGSDDGAGTAADPYATLEKAFGVAKAGTTIQVKGGTYYPRKSLKSQENGTARAPITLKPYGTDRVKVDGSKLPEGQWIVGLGGDHWHVSDMRFRNGPAHGFVATSSTGGVFENLTTEGNGDSGFTLRGEDTVNNLVKNLDSYGNYDPANHGQNADGLAVKFGSGKGNKVTGARLFNNSDDGADLWKFGTGLTIEHSWAYGNGKNRWNDGAFEGNGNGFKLGGDGTAAGHVVDYNAAWDNNQHGFTENSNPGAMRLSRNTAYANASAGFYFAEGSSELSRNLAAENTAEAAKTGGSTVSSGNSWDDGVTTPPFAGTDPASATGARGAGGALPVTKFLTVDAAAEIGSPMK